MVLRKPSNTRPTQAHVFKQLLRKCSILAKHNNTSSTHIIGYNIQKQNVDDQEHNTDQLPLDVPKGHFVVYVGYNRVRHIVPISYLTQPEFQMLLRRAEEEFGFDNEMGLTLPCEDDVFQSLTSTFR